MKKANKLIKFGDDVEGYSAPVLNEREIRASAGILFVLMFVALMFILFRDSFLLIKYVISVFLTDLLIRVFISPKFSPLLIIGRLVVSRQTPEYVGAAPKKFAWKIGIVLASLMFFLLVIVNSYSNITSISCLICLAFLFFESAFGICLGCLVYGWLYRGDSHYCAGAICELSRKENIPRTSRVQILILFGLVLCVFLAIIFFNDLFKVAPKNLWEIINSY